MAVPKETRKQEVDAVYEHGVFRVLHPSEVPLAEGQRVRLTVQPVQSKRKRSSLKLLENFYQGLSQEDIAEIEKIMLDRSNFRSKPIDVSGSP